MKLRLKSKFKIAIDGPAAAGKSTVSKIVATKLNYIYIDTGAMYRAITLKALDQNISYQDEGKLTNLLLETSIELKQSSDGQKVYLDGEDVSEDVRTEKVTNTVPFVSQHAKIREIMVRKQQELAEVGGVVMDGRDIGTHVLPHAEFKFFLIASAKERAYRRHQENIKRGFPSNLDVIEQEIIARDQEDMTREFSPLIKATDAKEIDTTSMTIDEVANFILAEVNKAES